jgi:hypothetical protein
VTCPHEPHGLGVRRIHAWRYDTCTRRELSKTRGADRSYPHAVALMLRRGEGSSVECQEDLPVDGIQEEIVVSVIVTVRHNDTATGSRRHGQSPSKATRSLAVQGASVDSFLTVNWQP